MQPNPKDVQEAAPNPGTEVAKMLKKMGYPDMQGVSTPSSVIGKAKGFTLRKAEGS